MAVARWPHPALAGVRRAAGTPAVLALLLAGCSAGVTGVRLPARSPLPPAAASARAVASPRAQVIAAITGYTRALGAADKSGSAAQARRLLEPYLAASRIDGLIRSMSSIWAKGEVFYGQDVTHITSVSIRGTSAFVHDCDDTSGMGLEYMSTGQPVPGSAGVPRENLITRLDQARGRWLVQFQLVEDVPCTP